MMLRHQAGARLIAQYDVNNTYQYIINRDDMQLSWLETAIDELGGTVAGARPSRSGPSGTKAEAARARASRRTPATRRRSSIAGGRASTRWPTRGTRKCCG